MRTELAAIRAAPGDAEADPARPFRLVSRRMPNVYNSSGREIESLSRGRRFNPAYLHPEDLAALGLASGDAVEIDSGHASILGVAESAPEMRRGVVSMAHGFGDAPEHDADFREIGSSTGRLVDNERDFEPRTGIPRMSAIPVAIRPAPASAPRRAPASSG